MYSLVLAIRKMIKDQHVQRITKRKMAKHLQTKFYSTIKQLGVIGAGQMGIGITLVASNVAKIPVILLDSNQEQLKKGIKFMDVLLKKDVLKGKITELEAQEAKERVTTTTSMDNFKTTDFVIEAVSENVSLKRDLFQKLDKITYPDTILATNTSSISITKIASATKKPQNVIGMHFMNPVPVMKLVEIIRGIATSDDTLSKTLELSKLLGKVTTTSKDIPGFIANRILMPYINEAIFVLQEVISDSVYKISK